MCYNGFTPLHFADDPAIVRLILEKKPALTQRDSSGETVPQQAAARLADARDKTQRQRWQQIVKLYEGAGEADLFTAITLGDLERVKVILAKSPALADEFQRASPLRMAASRGHFEICKYLLDNFKVDVNDFERGVGYPVIKEALAHPKVVRLLIERGADLKTEAIVNHPKFDLAEPKEKQALLDKCLRQGAWPTWLAREANRPKLMEVLIRKGANPNTSEGGVTPIQLAAAEIHPDHDDENADIKRTIAVLTKHGAKMDLFSAVAIGDERQVQALLAENSKSANARGPDGYPALHFAVGMNYQGIVAALLKAGGDVNIPNQSENTGSVGETALDFSEFCEHEEIAKLLIEAGGKRQAEIKPTEPAPSSTKSP